MTTGPARQPPGGAFHVAHTLTANDAATLTLSVAEQAIAPDEVALHMEGSRAWVSQGPECLCG